MAYSFFPNDFNNVPNLQDQLFLMKQKQDAQRLVEKARETEDVIIDDAETDEGEYIPTLQGRLAKGKGKKRGQQVDVEPGRAIVGVDKETEIHHAIELAGGDADKNNIYTTGRPLKVKTSEIKRV